MVICAAQLRSLPAEVDANVSRHLQLVDIAHREGAQCVVFPELSITGYEPALAGGLAISHLDARLDVFDERSLELGITICVGVPTPAEDGVCVSMVIFQPDGTRLVYSKQHLHEDERGFFVPGSTQVAFELEDQLIVPAICYESLLSEQGADAARMGADVYLASVSKPERNVKRAFSCLPELAARHSMIVLMCNAVGPSDDFVAAGSSAAWDEQGKLMGRAPKGREGLLLVDTTSRAARYQSDGARPSPR